jgi:hypothetical protein
MARHKGKIANKKTIICTNTTELKNRGKFLHELKWEWRNQVEKTVQGLEERGRK